ncbi:MAG: response regulator [Campylobacterales bacterium]|nr:response regulator [Campylobacterales bacterium]
MIKALIADDSQIMRKIIKTNLERYEVYDVLEVSNGDLALQLLITNKNINLLFLDLIMPNKNGLQVLKDFLKKESIEHLEIVAISNELTSDIVSKFSQLGVKNFIPKPFDIEQFKMVVVPILNKIKDKKVKRIDIQDVYKVFEDKHKSEFDGSKITINGSNGSLIIDYTNALKMGLLEFQKR